MLTPILILAAYAAISIWLLAIRVPDAIGARQPRSTPEARAFRFPAGWLKEAWCVHRHESVDWHRAGVDWAGRPSPYYGGMQMLLSTWQRAGGYGLPSDWPVREQMYRAYRIWDLGRGVRGDGRGSWREWGSAGKCGLA